MAWWLAYEELYGDMDKEYPIMTKNDDVTTLGGDETITFTGMSTAIGAADTINIGSPIFGSASPDTFDVGNIYSGVVGGLGDDHIVINSGLANTAYDDPKYYASQDTSYCYNFSDDPYPTIGALHRGAVHDPGTEQDKPKPDLKNASNHKYQEDKGIADLKSYVASTYQGHYTNKNSDVQTLDLIHSVGDAESFCRSNALKYLSRYDKKGSAKNDILKAMHYCLLLYYFSGNTQEPDYTNTRYETF